MPHLKLLKEIHYKGRTYKVGEIIEVGEDLAIKMILAGQARYSSKQAKSRALEQLTEKELKQICKELGIKNYSKKKKAELIELIKAKRSE